MMTDAPNFKDLAEFYDIDQGLLESPLGHYGINARACTILEGEGIKYVGDLIQKSMHDLLEIPTLNEEFRYELKAKVLNPYQLQHGMTLGNTELKDKRKQSLASSSIIVSEGLSKEIALINYTIEQIKKGDDTVNELPKFQARRDQLEKTATIAHGLTHLLISAGIDITDPQTVRSIVNFARHTTDKLTADI